ncbi:MAG: nucleoside deaminase [Candidatus Sericytochromatia bacterium]|nr:nucleoside deaminase [Candidatus Sericytochromatia bacterium]
MTHRHFMEAALEEARAAGHAGEVPVGAVLVHGGQVLCRSGNTRERDRNPLGHAELEVLREGARLLQRWRLDDCKLYVTLEPCAMCAAAAVQARIATVVFAAEDLERGACGSVWNLPAAPEMDHHPEVLGGIMDEPARGLLHEFFAGLRARRQG